MSRVLALCADDFGLAPGISIGIARLAQAHRISAVSCITNSTHWANEAPLLLHVGPKVELGLHFNLTEGRPLSAALAKVWPTLPALRSLVVLAHLGRLPRAALRVELEQQAKAFVTALGRAPDFIDGHQHVHHLPIVRGIVLDAVEHMQPMPAVRNTGCVLGPGFAVKRMLIERTGGRALARELALREVAHNAVLLGVYDFAQTDYRACMQRWLAALPPSGGLLFCHPGETGATDSADPIAAARARELAYLGSAGFAHDLADEEVKLGSVWSSVPSISETSSGG
jgi:predicted glycoside hydrolase/deacetylase ChbG (UPF0249 family)